MFKKIIFGAVFLVVGILVGILGTVSQWKFLTFNNTDLPLDIITLIAGLVALVIYYKQKSDFKKDAANIIYIEITNAESILKQTKENLEKGNPPTNALSIESMPTENWSKYKYLFVKDFGRKEWDSITDFYNKCKLFDESLRQLRSYFQKNEEQIRVNLYEKRTQLIDKNPVDINKIESNEAEKKKWEDFKILADNFYKQYMKDLGVYFYSPDKPILDAKFYLNNINLELSESSVGTKLIHLGNIKN